MAMTVTALVVAAVALVLLPSASSFPTLHDHEHVLFGKSDEEVKRELHYVYSWGYESPPPPEIAHHVTYYPPKTEGTIRHQRELQAQAFREMEEAQFQGARSREVLGGAMGGAGGANGASTGLRGRHLLQYTAAPPIDAAQAAAPYAAQAPTENPCLAPAAAPAGAAYSGKNFSEVLSDVTDQELNNRLFASLDQPVYPSDAPADVLNWTITNTLQLYGKAPRYSPKFGIATKSTSTGRWYTYVNKDIWWWGADDWSTQLWTCRFYQPGPKGFDCTYDRTCPGCDRCRGEHCFWNWNRHLYCSSSDCSVVASVLYQAEACAQQPINCGMSYRVGSGIDIGWPGIGGP